MSTHNALRGAAAVSVMVICIALGAGSALAAGAVARGMSKSGWADDSESASIGGPDALTKLLEVIN
ncbi:hypothetical protein PUR28_17865 [Streptomyces sp. BE308]|uniref:hypothetical protein n=1 Tax=Streptomyces sp. BE308 TaxID=3002529 RepID=UPI002E79D56A|nr:hypothetical protein [Streptomyces sp. BE308]MEE1792613.1 hypothetical protein [Streptomyces sp. BE308]